MRRSIPHSSVYLPVWVCANIKLWCLWSIYSRRLQCVYQIKGEIYSDLNFECSCNAVSDNGSHLCRSSMAASEKKTPTHIIFSAIFQDITSTLFVCHCRHCFGNFHVARNSGWLFAYKYLPSRKDARQWLEHVIREFRRWFECEMKASEKRLTKISDTPYYTYLPIPCYSNVKTFPLPLSQWLRIGLLSVLCASYTMNEQKVWCVANRIDWEKISQTAMRFGNVYFALLSFRNHTIDK